MVFDGDIVSAKVKGKPKPKRLEPRLKFDVNEEDKNLVCKLLQQRESSPPLNSKHGNSTSCILFNQNDQFAKQRLLFTGLIWEVVTLVENDEEKRNLLYSKLAKRLGDFAGFQHLDLKLKTLDPLRNRVRSTLNHLILTLKTDLDATITSTTGQNGFNGRRLPSLNSRHDKILSFYNDSYFLEPSRFQREYENLGLIEEGGFGFVCKVTNKLDGNSYALKVVPFRYKTCEAYERIMREVRVFASLKSHPNLVAYKTSWLEKCIFGGKSSLSRMAKLALPSVSQATTVTATDSNSDVASSCVKIIEISDKSASLSSLSVIDQSPEVEPIVGSPEDVENFTRIIKSEGYLVDDNFFFNNRVRTSSSSSESSNGFDFGASLYIQMELCDKNLKTWIKERNDRLLKLASKNGQTKCLLDHIDLTECLNIFKEILIGLKAIHDNQLIHRDLKPQNILFGLDGRVKIGDFGLSTIDQCREEQLISSVVFATQPLQKKGKGHTMGLGTSAYAAPEQKLSRKYDRKVDIYSLGMVAFEVFHPFVTNMERSKTFDDLTRNHSLPSEFSASLPEVAKLILRMTSALPVDRPDANEILHSDLFAQDGHSEMDELRKEVAILRSQLIEKDEEIKRLKEALLLKS